jgi:hypothetical protein
MLTRNLVSVRIWLTELILAPFSELSSVHLDGFATYFALTTETFRNVGHTNALGRCSVELIDKLQTAHRSEDAN